MTSTYIDSYGAVYEPTHYKMLALTFGDITSGNIETLALRKTVEKCEKEYPMAFQVIEKDYVDELISSADDMETAQYLLKETEEVLPRGGFEIKHWICSSTQEAVEHS